MVDFTSISAWESSLHNCKDPKKHRLYHAMGERCPCMKGIWDIGVWTFEPFSWDVDEVINEVQNEFRNQQQ